MRASEVHCQYCGPGPDTCPHAIREGNVVLPCADCPLRRWQVEFCEGKPLYRERHDPDPDTVEAYRKLLGLNRDNPDH